MIPFSRVLPPLRSLACCRRDGGMGDIHALPLQWHWSFFKRECTLHCALPFYSLMMSRLCAVLLLISLAVFSSGCGLAKRGLASMGSSKKGARDKEEKTKAGRDTYVGVIESVNPEQQFVLVRMELGMAIAAGTRLETRSPSGLLSRLVAGPERKLNFLAADILEGVPHAGDVVVLPASSVQPGTQPGAPGTDPAKPGKLEPILTAEPPPGSQPQPGVYSSPLPSADGSSSYPVPGVPDANPVPGVPPTGFPTPQLRVNPR